MRFTSAWQLKDWIKNKSKQTGTPPNVLLQTYMMERLVERVSISPYRNNLILKGGFLISAMVGIDRRTTKDLDATAKGLALSRDGIKGILAEIISLDADDGAVFEIQSIRNIHDISEYDDFRVSIRASIHAIRVNMKIDITIGDTIIPQEIEYQYKLMFEDRTIPVMAYNLYTILAEKIETILSRNVTNSRGRDFYDAYTLLSIHRDTMSREALLNAIHAKAEERGSLKDIEDHAKHLRNIADSPEMAKVWAMYTRSYPYAKGIAMVDILSMIGSILEQPTHFD
jgi:predicted nucleotidyltransferase component of viral defense system